MFEMRQDKKSKEESLNMMIKSAGIITRKSKLVGGQKQFCVVRKYGTDKFIIPGGQIEKGETDYQALERELLEELSIETKSAKWFGSFSGLSAFEKEPLEIRVYRVRIKGKPSPNSEIAELAWIGRDYDIPVGDMLKPIISAMIESNII